MRTTTAAALALLLTACALAPDAPPGIGAPPAAAPAPSRPQPVSAVARPNAAATAHPLATQAALATLAAGGNALDATIAAQMVLGLVEPQSSGIGGGALLLVWDPTAASAAARLTSYDGLAAAPARATASLRTDADGRLLPLDAVARGARSVGVPGALAAFEQAHRAHGRLPWAQLFGPAIELAERGVPIAPYLHDVLAADPGATAHPAFRADYFGADGRVLPVGTPVRQPALAETLRAIAAHGAQGFWRNGGAARLAAALAQGPHPSFIGTDDVLGYRAAERTPLCAPVERWRICTTPPPSFGGVAVLQMLQMLAARADAPPDPSTEAFWHLYVEAGRLAQADRRHWIGDPDHVRVDAAALVAPGYVRARAQAISTERAASSVGHGQPPVVSGQAAPAALRAPMAVEVAAVANVGSPVDIANTANTADTANAASADQTSQIVVADASGMVVSTTTTINLNFGSRLRVDGYVLNNALTNFGPAAEPGRPAANAMAPGKRPVTSMAPVMVFDERGQPWIAGGSAGGGQIVDYIAGNLVRMLWQGRTPAEALAEGHVSTALAPRVQLEAGSARAALADGLRRRGHDVAVEATRSGVGFLQRRGTGWLGAADPRRDGVALGY